MLLTDGNPNATEDLRIYESAILGVEAPLWSETPATMSDVEFLAFPRLVVVAEVAWSVESVRQWDEFRVRLGAQAPNINRDCSRRKPYSTGFSYPRR